MKLIMGETCSTCCTTAEEGKGEINDVNNEQNKKTITNQKYAKTNGQTKPTQVSPYCYLEKLEEGQDRRHAHAHESTGVRAWLPAAQKVQNHEAHF
jgi:hypothetical protein